MQRRTVRLFALPFGTVSLATLGLFFLADQSLDSVHVASRLANVWLDSLRNTGLQIERCLDLGGSECERIEDQLRRPLAYVRATQEREKADPDERIIRESLREMGNDISLLRFRWYWYETVARTAGLNSQDPREQKQSPLQHWLDLAKRAKAARSGPLPDAAAIAILKRDVSETIAQSEIGRTAFLARADQAVGRLRRVLYLLVIACVLFMFLVATWVSQRLFVAWETQERKYKERDVELSAALALRVDELQHAVKAKGVLLREVQHRVKNNLQLISSLARLQSRQPEHAAAAEALSALRRRVDSMALIHEGLCFSETPAEIDFAKYATNLAHRLLQSYAMQPGQIQLHIDVQVILPLEEAMLCGLIMNELLSNSLKHAFPAGRRGELWIAVGEESGTVTLEVRDNGIGMPAGFSVERADSLGLLIVSDLAAQLQGDSSWTNGRGAAFRVRFQRRALSTIDIESVSSADGAAGEARA